MRVREVHDIGAMVRDRRRARGWDQKTLADRIGVSRVWLSELENGKATVQLDLVMRALAALDLGIDIGGGEQGAGKSVSATLLRRALEDL